MNSGGLLKYIAGPAFGFVLFFSTTSALAKATSRYLFYIGGGETVAQNPKATNFDYSFSYVRNLEKDNWKARYLFAGEQTNSNRLRQEVAGRSKTLTQGNLVPFLENIEKTLASGDLNYGQLLIYLDTHGVMDDGKYTITTIDGNFDILPSLNKIKALAKEKKVKLGIIGATCYSGQLIDLEDSNTCVVTTSPSDTVGLMMNNNVIAYLLGHHATKNLEDLHLQSRKFKDIDLGQPLISTAAGKKAYEVLKDLRTTVLVAGKKSAPEIYSCDQNGVEKTLGKINALINPPLPSAVVTDGKAASNSSLAHGKTSFISEKYIGKLKNLDQKLKTLLGQHREALVSMLTNSCQSLNPDLQENPPCDLSHKTISERNTSTIEEQGIVLKLVDLPKDFPKNSSDEAAESPKVKLEQLIKTSAEIGAIERDLYEILYKKFAEETSSGPNICQSFTTN